MLLIRNNLASDYADLSVEFRRKAFATKDKSSLIYGFIMVEGKNFNWRIPAARLFFQEVIAFVW
jgi:hypothetical protein